MISRVWYGLKKAAEEVAHSQLPHSQHTHPNIHLVCLTTDDEREGRTWKKDDTCLHPVWSNKNRGMGERNHEAYANHLMLGSLQP